MRLDAVYAEVNGTTTMVEFPTAVTLVGTFRQPKGNSPALSTSNSNVSAALSGSFGDNATFPRTVSIVARESVRREQWEIIVQLDRATDRGATNLPYPSAAESAAAAALEAPPAPPLSCDPDGELSWPCLERIFSVLPADAFSDAGVVARTSGAWRDASTLVLTTALDVTGSTFVLLEGETVPYGSDQEPTLQLGTTVGLFTSGLTANGTQRCELFGSPEESECPSLTTLPSPEPPRLISFEASDPDNGDASLSAGDVFLLRFDRDVDRAGCAPSCAGGREFVHRLFSFSAPLASDYSGAWDTADNRTFVVMVTEVAAGTHRAHACNPMASSLPPHGAPSLPPYFATQSAPRIWPRWPRASSRRTRPR